MGGRGTFAVGNIVPYVYETVGFIEGVKVLEGVDGKHGLPEEAHSSSAYIKLKPDGTFHEMRFYDKDHYLVFEIAYHPEKKLDPSNKPVLHYHTYDRNFGRSEAIKMPKAMKKRYAKYMKGVLS
ncbi:MAG: hypothetical protein J5782_04235 [Clostridia bacterium]|nr:hypothetical protein [Clostridia bacterium]